MTGKLRPMSEFDPTEPAMVHDALNDRSFAWSPDFEWSFAKHAREQAPGVINFDGPPWTGVRNRRPKARLAAEAVRLRELSVLVAIERARMLAVEEGGQLLADFCPDGGFE
jgi:hypothetical protein